jgi:uncharacterized protein with WD repeat
VTHSRAPKEGYVKNLQVWDTEDGDMVAAFHKKGVTSDNWPAIQFCAEETHLFLMVKDAVAAYDMAGDFTEQSYKVKMDNISQFAVCITPGKKTFASFVPETSGAKSNNMPAVIAVSEWKEGGGVTNRKQFYRVRLPPMHAQQCEQNVELASRVNEVLAYSHSHYISASECFSLWKMKR